MKKITWIEVRWQCGICKEIYHTKELAAECESRPVRKPRFKLKVGDLISARYLRECWAGVGGECGHTFLPMVRIVRVGLNTAHEPEYRATYDCPKCGRRLQDDFMEHEIKPPIQRSKPAKQRKKSA